MARDMIFAPFTKEQIQSIYEFVRRNPFLFLCRCGNDSQMPSTEGMVCGACDFVDISVPEYLTRFDQITDDLNRRRRNKAGKVQNGRRSDQTSDSFPLGERYNLIGRN